MEKVKRACAVCGTEFDALPLGGPKYGAKYCPEHAPRDSTERSRLYRQTHPAETLRNVRRASLKRNYGISLEEAEAIHQAQGGRCALCLEPVAFDGRGRAIDHDHATGRVRGILCARCNKLLGYLEALTCSPRAWLSRADAYCKP